MPPVSIGFGSLRLASLQVKARSRRINTRNDLFKVSEEVQDALATGKPVVALESTIYTHGFPYPDNVALSSHLESLVRAHGGVPATIGILNGQALVGMQPEQLIQLVSTAGSTNTWKVSRRDLGFIGGLGLRGNQLNGGTTIAGTMILAHLAGIKIFATGGLGGVHRGAENSMDVSADLTELGRTPVTVISSGCKSFLDIPRTLEYLETQGVGVGTFADGRDGIIDFPAFYSRDSGVKSPKVIKDEAEAAAIVFAQSRYPLQSGLLFANPVPAHSEVPKAEMDVTIEQALKEADQAGIIGAANTPYVLKRIKELSRGASIPANRALIAANVKRGTKVAVELAKLELQEQGRLERDSSMQSSNFTPLFPQPRSVSPASSSLSALSAAPIFSRPIDVLVAGSLASDIICDYVPLSTRDRGTSPSLHTSNPGVIAQSMGGVGSNVARAAHYAGASVLLASVLANDIAGQTLRKAVQDMGMSTEGIMTLPDARTAQYVAMNDGRKNLQIAMSDMSILLNSSLESEEYWTNLMIKHKPRWVVVDANWSSHILGTIVKTAGNAEAKIAFEPVSNEKGARLFQRSTKAIGDEDIFPNHKIDLATPNAFELDAMHLAAREAGLFEGPGWWDVVNHMNLSAGGSRDLLVRALGTALVEKGVPQMMLQLVPYVPQLVVKLGADGCLIIQLLPVGDERLTEPQSNRYILARSEDHTGGNVGGVYIRLFPAAEVVGDEDVVSVNGVGDTMLGVIMAGLTNGHVERRLEDVIGIAQSAAVMTLKSDQAVSPEVKTVQQMLTGGPRGLNYGSGLKTEDRKERF